jgi:thioredoxin reductase (NADPH)
LDAVIVGTGPAGIAAAIQLRRSGVDFALFEQKAIGGLLLNAHLVENYPGFPRGISGPDLVGRFQQQLERWEIPVVQDRVNKVECEDKLFQVTTRDGRELACRYLVAASGTVARELPLSLFQEGMEDKVLYDVFPIRDIRGRHVGIVGAGDAAFDYGLQLAQHNHVTIFCRDSGPCCLPLLSERAEESSRLNVRFGTELVSVERATNGLLLRLDTAQDSQSQALEVDLLLAAVGRSPALGFLDPLVENSRASLSRRGRLYLAGDVNNDLFRQTGICVGDGIRAAMQICESIRMLKP